MNWLDPLIAGIVIYAAARGFQKGLLAALGDVLGALLALILAYAYYPLLGAQLARLAIHPLLANVLAFVFIAVTAGFGFSLLGHLGGRRLAQSRLALFDRISGAGFNTLFALLLITVSLVLLIALPFDSPTRWVDGSYLSRALLGAAPAVYRAILPLLPGARQAETEGTGGSDPLPFPLPRGGGRI